MPRPVVRPPCRSSRWLAVCLALLAPRRGVRADAVAGGAEERRASRLDGWSNGPRPSSATSRARRRRRPGASSRDGTRRDLAELTDQHLLRARPAARSLDAHVHRPPRPEPPAPRRCSTAASEIRRLLAASRRGSVRSVKLVCSAAARCCTSTSSCSDPVPTPPAAAGTAALLHLPVLDGQQLASGRDGHWDIGAIPAGPGVAGKARDIRPSPARDDWVRRWYRTATLFMLAQMQLHGRGIVDAGSSSFPTIRNCCFSPAPSTKRWRRRPSRSRCAWPISARRRPGRVDHAEPSSTPAEDLLSVRSSAGPTSPKRACTSGKCSPSSERHKDALPELAPALASTQERDPAGIYGASVRRPFGRGARRRRGGACRVRRGVAASAPARPVAAAGPEPAGLQPRRDSTRRGRCWRGSSRCATPTTRRRSVVDLYSVGGAVLRAVESRTSATGLREEMPR